MNLRHLLSWKPLFYEGILPALRRLGPVRCNAALEQAGRLLLLWPWRKRELIRALHRAQQALEVRWDPAVLCSSLAANAVRFTARDYPLHGVSDAEALARFDVEGFEALGDTLKKGQGAILVGSHLGGATSRACTGSTGATFPCASWFNAPSMCRPRSRNASSGTNPMRKPPFS